MKKIVYFLLTVLTLSSCSKDEDDTSPSTTTQYVKEITFDFPAGQQTIMQFKYNNKLIDTVTIQEFGVIRTIAINYNYSRKLITEIITEANGTIESTKFRYGIQNKLSFVERPILLGSTSFVYENSGKKVIGKYVSWTNDTSTTAYEIINNRISSYRTSSSLSDGRQYNTYGRYTYDKNSNLIKNERFTGDSPNSDSLYSSFEYNYEFGKNPFSNQFESLYLYNPSLLIFSAPYEFISLYSNNNVSAFPGGNIEYTYNSNKYPIDAQVKIIDDQQEEEIWVNITYTYY